MKSGWFAATVAALSALTAAAFDSSGTLLLEERCDTPSKLVRRSGEHVALPNGTAALKVTGSEKRPFSGVRLRLPLKPEHAEKVLYLRARLKYENVSKPLRPWNGVKFMITTRQNGKFQYHQRGSEYGSREWFDAEIYAPLDPGAEPQATFSIGLEDSTGTLYVRDIQARVMNLTDLYPAYAPAGYRPQYTRRVLDERRRRGTMSPSTFLPDSTISQDLPELKRWGANLIRWQLIRNWGKTGTDQDTAEYLEWVKARIPEVRQVLDFAAENDMKVVLDLHVPPGGRRKRGDMNMFHERKFADAFLEAWKLLASAVKGHPALYGYDLINEPTAWSKTPIDYLGLQYEAAKVVRAIDPKTPIIVESNLWCKAATYKYMQLIPLPDVIYQLHFYTPTEYTHMGVGGRKNRPEFRYPGKFRTTGGSEIMLDKNYLREQLRPVREFQLRHGAKIYVGEFSAVRWAAGREQYLADLIDLFEEYGWDWSYHAFREWSGWSVEHSDNKEETEPTTAPTRAKQVLLEAFKRNQSRP